MPGNLSDETSVRLMASLVFVLPHGVRCKMFALKNMEQMYALTPFFVLLFGIRLVFIPFDRETGMRFGRRSEGFGLSEIDAERLEAHDRRTAMPFYEPECNDSRSFHSFVKALISAKAGNFMFNVSYAPFHRGQELHRRSAARSSTHPQTGMHFTRARDGRLARKDK